VFFGNLIGSVVYGGLLAIALTNFSAAKFQFATIADAALVTIS
jgi:hypothetical protein